MPRLLTSYAANKRVEDGLRRKQEQIRLDYIRTTHRYLDETEKLVDDLIHINVRTPSAFELDTLPMTGSVGESHMTHPSHSKSAVSSQINYQPIISGSQQTLDSLKDAGSSEKEKQGFSTGVSPANFRTELGSCKAPGHPLIQIRNNEVFYQYQKQPKNWKKVEPTYKTKLILHRNNAVIQALKNFSSRNDDVSESPSSEDIPMYANSSRRRSSVFAADAFSRRDSLFSRRESRRDSRFTLIDSGGCRRNSTARPMVEVPPPLSPGHTPRMLDGWTIMKWCLWNKQQTTPVWATRRYAEIKHREYQKFITSMNNKRKSEEKQKTTVKDKPSSANTVSSMSSRKDQRSEESLMAAGERKPSLPRAKSVPVGRIHHVAASPSVIEGDVSHFPSIDRGIIRPTTSILRVTATDCDNDDKSDDNVYADDNECRIEEGASRLKPEPQRRRRVALDTCPVDDIKDVFRTKDNYDEFARDFGKNSPRNKPRSVYSAGSSSSKSTKAAGKHVSYGDEESFVSNVQHSPLTWGALAEVDNETSGEEDY